MELSITLALEASPQICHQDLCSLVETHSLAFESDFVSETWKMVHQEVDQCSCRTICFFDAVPELAVEALLGLAATSNCPSTD